MMVPKLRFSEFNKGWQQKKTGDVFTIFSGFAFKSTDATTSGCRWLKIADVGCQVMTPGTPSFLPNHFRNEYHKFIIRKDDYVIALTRPILNGKLKIAIAGKEYDGSLLNQRVGKIVTKNNPKFVYSLLQMESTVSQINNCIAGTDPPNLSTQDIKDMVVFVPIIEEQTKIADFLSSVDEKIALLKKQYDLLCQYKKGMMQKIFSQEVRFKDENGEEFPEWEAKQLSEIAIINPKNKVIPSKFIYIDLESVEKGMLLKEQLINKDDAPSRAQRLLVPGDVLFQLVRPYQKNNYIFLLDGDYVASTGYAQLRAKYNSLFLYQLLHLESFTSEVMNRCTGTSYPAINSSDLASIEVEIPCEKEQTKIANLLSALDDKISVKKAELDKLKTWKQGLLQQMFV
ncbi:restriction endonuclease subunit S [Yersinia enterocolitica]